MQQWFSIIVTSKHLVEDQTVSKCSVRMMSLTNVKTYERTNRLSYVITIRIEMWQTIYDNFLWLPDNLKHNILYETNNIKEII